MISIRLIFNDYPCQLICLPLDLRFEQIKMANIIPLQTLCSQYIADQESLLFDRS